MGSFVCFSGGNICLDLMNRDEIFNTGHSSAAEPVLELSEAASCDLSTVIYPLMNIPSSKGEGRCFLREQKDICLTPSNGVSILKWANNELLRTFKL